MKKIISLILALVMVMGLAVTANAANIEITAPTGTGDMSNLTYTAYKVFSATVTESGTGYSYTMQMDGPFYDVVYNNKTTVFSGSGISVPGQDGWVYVTVASGYDADDVINVLKNSSNKGTGIPATYSGDKFVINNVEPGYYYIESSFGTGILLDTVGKETIEIQPKNELPTLEKSIIKINGNNITATDSYTANIGDTITFELKVTIPATAKVGTTIYLHDFMSNGLQSNNSNPFYGSGSGTKFDDPMHTWNSGHDSSYTCMGEYTITAADLGTTITETYDAVLTADAVIGSGNKNEAWLVYGDYTTEKDEVNIYTYQIDVYKYTGTRANPLPGAGFKLKNAEGKYYTNTNGFVTWTETGTEYTTSTENGCLVNFVGLANGTYTLEESTVPAGYNKAADQTLTISDASLIGDSQVDVENVSGSELPSTGGMGTTLFYVIGGLMMTCAVVVLVTKRRVA